MLSILQQVVLYADRHHQNACSTTIEGMAALVPVSQRIDAVDLCARVEDEIGPKRLVEAQPPPRLSVNFDVARR